MNLKLDKLFFIILFSVFLFTTLKAEIVNKINITGNQRVSDETVKIYGEIDINKKKDVFNLLIRDEIENKKTISVI